MFKIGDKIVYPNHGAGTIDSIEKKEFLGEEKDYYILKMPIGSMDISIPLSNIDKMNIRDVISKDEGDQVLTILDEDPTEMPSNWNVRYRENQEIIKTGDIFEIAKMVRNLSILDKEKAEQMIDESIGLWNKECKWKEFFKFLSHLLV